MEYVGNGDKHNTALFVDMINDMLPKTRKHLFDEKEDFNTNANMRKLKVLTVIRLKKIHWIRKVPNLLNPWTN
jgi:hypothetical protein